MKMEVGTNWDVQLRAAAIMLPELFLAKSLEIAPNEVIQHLDKTLRGLLYASAAAKLDIDDSRQDNPIPVIYMIYSGYISKSTFCRPISLR